MSAVYWLDPAAFPQIPENKQLIEALDGNGSENISVSTDRKRALVVFGGRTEIALLRILKPGFRHCFVVVGGRYGWIFLNPLLHYTELEWIDGFDPSDVEALTAFYRRLGYTVLETVPTCPPRRALVPTPYSCVEAVKRVLGIRAGWVLTPWQLYRYLNKNLNIENNP
jgi:hypothetical protein